MPTLPRNGTAIDRSEQWKEVGRVERFAKPIIFANCNRWVSRSLSSGRPKAGSGLRNPSFDPQ
jgi:hypothetical protein